MGQLTVCRHYEQPWSMEQLDDFERKVIKSIKDARGLYSSL